MSEKNKKNISISLPDDWSSFVEWSMEEADGCISVSRFPEFSNSSDDHKKDAKKEVAPKLETFAL